MRVNVDEEKAYSDTAGVCMSAKLGNQLIVSLNLLCDDSFKCQ